MLLLLLVLLFFLAFFVPSSSFHFSQSKTSLKMLNLPKVLAPYLTASAILVGGTAMVHAADGGALVGSRSAEYVDEFGEGLAKQSEKGVAEVFIN